MGIGLGAERRDLLLRWVTEDGRVHAADAAQRLGVSLDTVRRDLQELAGQGLVRRVHGGALPPHPPGPDSFAARLDDDRAAKSAVAAAAAELVRPGEVIAISGGATGLELARRLPAGLEATVIVTNPEIGLALAAHPRLNVDLVGGRLDRRSRTVLGADAVAALRAVRPDACFLSACSIHAAAGVTLRDRDEAAVVRAMAEQSGRVVALATTAKLNTAGPYPVVSADHLATLVTDAPEEACGPYRALGVEVIRT